MFQILHFEKPIPFMRFAKSGMVFSALLTMLALFCLSGLASQPAAALPAFADIRRDYEILEITRTLTFTNSNLLDAKSR